MGGVAPLSKRVLGYGRGLRKRKGRRDERTLRPGAGHWSSNKKLYFIQRYGPNEVVFTTNRGLFMLT